MSKERSVTVIDVDIEKVEFNPLNVNGGLKNPKTIAWLAESYTRYGRFINHPVITPRSNGKYVCIAGEGRIIALRSLGHKKVKSLVYQGLGNEEAMAILGEDNALARTQVSIARAIEAYWIFKHELKRSQDQEKAFQHAQNIYQSKEHIENFYIAPGWYLACSEIVNDFMRKIGPRREHLDRHLAEQAKFLAVRLYMLGFIARPLLPLDPFEYLESPCEQDRDAFDRLLEQALALDLERIKRLDFERALSGEISQEARLRAERLEELAQQTDEHDRLLQILAAVQRIAYISLLHESDRVAIRESRKNIARLLEK